MIPSGTVPRLTPSQSGTQGFLTARESMASPLAKALFQIDGVQQVWGVAPLAACDGAQTWRVWWSTYPSPGLHTKVGRCQDLPAADTPPSPPPLQVFFGTNFVTVTKTDTYPWAVLKPDIFAAITDFYSSGKPVLLEGGAVENLDNVINDDDDEVLVGMHAQRVGGDP